MGMIARAKVTPSHSSPWRASSQSGPSIVTTAKAKVILAFSSAPAVASLEQAPSISRIASAVLARCASVSAASCECGAAAPSTELSECTASRTAARRWLRSITLVKVPLHQEEMAIHSAQKPTRCKR